MIVYKSDNNGTTFDQIASGNNLDVAVRFIMYNTTYKTILNIYCKDTGPPGGFIATININNIDYYTNNPISESEFEIVSLTDGIVSPLVYR